ncbi:MAG: hypothetical protein ACRDRT_05755, partial [Pseudonocardiaceae bacterium]
MTATNGHDTGHGTSKAAVSQARPIVLLRYRPGLAPESARVVHLVPLPPEGTGAVSALCGALLRPQEYETLTPGQGMPCSGCVISHTHGDQVWLSVDGDVVALLLPSLLAAEVSAILTRRHCAPAVLVVHPYA